MEKRILIADDSAFMRMMLREVLTKNSFTVVDEAENGSEAVTKYASTKPDLVLLDVTMPGMDGLEALKQIKKMDSRVKVIMCSAMGQESIVIESIKNGASDFIVKPFQADKLIETLKKVLK